MNPTRSSLLLLAALAVGCGESGSKIDDPGPNVGDDSLNATARLLRGPYLQAATGTSMVISWATDIAAGSKVRVEGMMVGGATSLEFEGRTFGGEDVDGQHPLDGFQHEVVVKGLMPSMSYRYVITSLPAETAPATFQTAPTAGEAFDFVVYGDTRTEPTRHQEVIAAIMPHAPELAIFTGDAVTVGNDDEEWDRFFMIEKPLLESAVYYPAFGNHEALLGKAAFDTLYRAPAGAFSERTYSFDHGSLHVAIVDPYDARRRDLLAWLDADLAAATTQGARFKIIAMHPAIYTFSKHVPDVSLRNDLSPIITRNGVHAVFVGHNHVYEHFAVEGVHHFVVGGGGAPAYGTNEQAAPVDPANLRCAAMEGLSFIIGSVSGDVMTLRAKTSAGALIETITIDATKGLAATCATP